MKVEYYVTDAAWHKYFTELKTLVQREDVKKVCDIGGGANPLLSVDEINQYGLEYTLLDISAEELAKAPSEYRKIQADITDPSLSIEQEKFDLICSKFLAEHVSSGFTFHQNIFNFLREGGYALHYFPTLYNLPYLMNLLLDEKISEPILLYFQPHRIQEGNEKKFKAYYDWCRGPTRKNINRLQSIGYSAVKYLGFFGHGFYDKTKLLIIFSLIERLKTQFLLKYPLPQFTQCAVILLKKDNLRR